MLMFQRKVFDVLVSDEEGAIRLCKQKDAHGLVILIHKYQLQALRVAYLILSDHAAAEDVVQESFIRVWNSISSFKEQAVFKHWFMRIVVNCANMHQRTIARHPSVGIDDINLHSFVASSRASDPVTSAELTELRTMMHQALMTLTPAQRTAVVLHYYGGYTSPEIAQIVGCQISAARRRIHDGLVALERTLKRLNPQLEDTQF